MEAKNRKILIITVIVAIFSILLITVLNFTNGGFKISTYATENLLVEQIEEILSEEGLTKEVNEIYRGSIEDDYLGIFIVDGTENKECIIVNYEEVGQLGDNKILELTRVIKGENGLVVIDINEKYIIFSAIDKEDYTGFNILNNNGELVSEIFLDDLDEALIAEFEDENFVLEFENIELESGIKVELVKKSE